VFGLDHPSNTTSRLPTLPASLNFLRSLAFNKMVEVKSYKLPPTALMPNSPWPLLYYSGFFANETDCNTVKVYDLFSSNGWQVQWIFRYGDTQYAHYHSAAHECMAVLSGTATIRFGVADTDDDLEKNTHGSSKEEGGIELQANAGDVFVIPAGVSHKTFDTRPSASFERLTPGDGHHVSGEDVRKALADIELSGFTMIGAYPRGSEWDFMKGGEDTDNYEKVWSVPKPDKDPVFGNSSSGVCGLWEGSGHTSREMNIC
jgi:uncharacterized protein YjlB